MNHLGQLPAAVAVIVAIFLIIGSSLALLGSIGLVRLKSFYQRLHAPTLSYSYGTLLTILSSMLMFSFLETRPVIHELVIGIFIIVTSPITLLMLGRAALRRDQDAKLKHEEDVPARDSLRGGQSEPVISPATQPASDAKAPGQPHQ